LKAKIDADALEKWLNLLEGYYLFQKFSTMKKITFALLKSLPHVKYWWEGYWEQHNRDESTTFGKNPLGWLLLMPSRRNSTLLETMMTST
jgi:hypothetical protein